MLDGNCTFNVLVYADADSDVPLEWGDSDAKEIKNGEKVQLRSFSSSNHRVDTLVSYRYVGSNTVVHVLGLMIVDLAISRTLTETTASVAGNADLLSKRNPVFVPCRLSAAGQPYLRTFNRHPSHPSQLRDRRPFLR